MKRRSIVFVQGDEAEPVIDRLTRCEGVVIHSATPRDIADTVAYLRQWEPDDLSDAPIVIRPRAFPGEEIATAGPYILAWHPGLTYVALDRMVKD